jgi:hypothetical protein
LLDERVVIYTCLFFLIHAARLHPAGVSRRLLSVGILLCRPSIHPLLFTLASQAPDTAALVIVLLEVISFSTEKR